MPRMHKSHRLYRALLHLYPKSHRKAYGEQMVQTLDDILADQQNAREKIGVWIRIGSEMPLNIIEENINNMGEMGMNKLSKILNKQLAIGIGAFVAIVAGVGISVALLHHNDQFTPTTLSQVKHAVNQPVCLQKSHDPNVKVTAEDQTFIENNVATSILDVPAGTNVNAYLKTYDGKKATGSAVYSAKYGSYNFTAEKVAENSTNPYVGGWKITHFEACK